MERSRDPWVSKLCRDTALGAILRGRLHPLKSDVMGQMVICGDRGVGTQDTLRAAETGASVADGGEGIDGSFSAIKFPSAVAFLGVGALPFRDLSNISLPHEEAMGAIFSQ